MRIDRSIQDVGATFLTQEELADRWKCHEETIKRMRRRGELLFVVIGGRMVRIPMGEVLRIEKEGEVRV
ncbi:MAG: helix-turn-helix domain-containing protein [Verrucomicrobiae bacterium]|nr:helix-turn-helix domain-containing protein [Verrucomicrobiae bacterium]